MNEKLCDFIKWVIWPGAVIVLILVVLTLAVIIDRAKFDLCIESHNTLAYCTIQHPLGAHGQ